MLPTKHSTPLLCLASLGLPLLLAGCAAPVTVAPDLAPLASPQWHAPLPHDGRLAELRQWWSQFDDPLLLALIDAAQDASPTLALAQANIADARAARVAGGAALLPTLGLAANASRARSDLTTPPGNSATLGLEAGWELDLFGANRAGRDAAEARLLASEARWHEARVSLAAEVARHYVELRACEAQLRQAELDAQSRAATARLTEATAAAGTRAPAAAHLARASAAEGRVALVQQQTRCELLVKALVALAAREEPALRADLAPGSARLPEPAGFGVHAVPAQALAQRPDLLAAARDVMAASFDAVQASARRWPRITLAGSIGAMRSSGGGVSADGGTWSVGPVAVTFPLFDGGARRSALEAARSRYGAAKAAYAGRLRGAIEEVERALVGLDSSARRSADAGAAVDGFEQAYRATLASYEAGAANLFELEEARRSLRSANSALIDQRSDRLLAWISLYRALGGGWTGELPGALRSAIHGKTGTDTLTFSIDPRKTR